MDKETAERLRAEVQARLQIPVAIERFGPRTAQGIQWSIAISDRTGYSIRCTQEDQVRAYLRSV